MRLPLATPRLTLRRLSPDDLPRFQAYRSDPEVARFQGWEAMDAAAAGRFLAGASTAPLLERGRWTQIGIDDGTGLVGDMGLHLNETELEMGVTLSRGAQGRGLGLEAVEAACAWVWAATDAQAIVAITDRRNRGALALLSRLPGFVEGPVADGYAVDAEKERAFRRPRA